MAVKCVIATQLPIQLIQVPCPSFPFTSGLVKKVQYDSFKNLFTLDRRLMLGYQTEDIIQLIVYPYQ